MDLTDAVEKGFLGVFKASSERATWGAVHAPGFL
jgi:hypothetical protein